MWSIDRYAGGKQVSEGNWKAIKNQGGKMIVQGGVLKGKKYSSGCYVLPCIAEVRNDMPIVLTRNLCTHFIMSYHIPLWKKLSHLQNGVPQGLSSSIMTSESSGS